MVVFSVLSYGWFQQVLCSGWLVSVSMSFSGAM